MHGMFGIETLSVRMKKHCSNAEEMVKYLLGHESVAWVSRPSVPDHPDHELAKELYQMVVVPDSIWN